MSKVIYPNVDVAIKNKNLSRSKVAEALGISDPTFNLLLQGTRKFSVDRMTKVAILLDVSIDYLVGLTDDPRKLWGYDVGFIESSFENLS